MMKIHKEGYNLITFFVLLVAAILVAITLIFKDITVYHILLYFAAAIFLLFIIRFFRSPERKLEMSEDKVFSPADGKIVVIEKVTENEYFKDERIQVSIFMSAYDVHINWYPVSGPVKYFKYHEGSYIIARHPKSSEKNERTSLVIETRNHGEILVRQIAGLVARRIVFYGKKGENVKQGDQMGFIKFGSRVDLFFPMNVKLNIKLNQKVKGANTVIASFR